MNAAEIAAAFEDIFDQALVFHGFTDYKRDYDLDGFVWGVKWHSLYPGLTLVADSERTGAWSNALGIPFHEATIQTEAHDISLLFSDLVVSAVQPGWSPFVIEDGDGPDVKTPLA